MSGYSGVVQSQDTYVAPGVPLSVIGSGGGGGSNLPANIAVSSIIAGAGTFSTINGVLPGSLPASASFSTISTFVLNGVSSINGNPYVSTVPLNFTNNSISTNSLICSSINTFSTDDIPYVYIQPNGLVDRVISSISVTAGNNALQAAIASGAPLAGNISTVQGRSYTVSGPARIGPYLSSGFPVGSPNAYLYLVGGGGGGASFINKTWPYPFISTMSGMNGLGAINFTYTDFQWSAPGSYTGVNQEQPGAPGNSTIQYYLCCSPDWPTPINIKVSSIVGNITNTDVYQVRIIDNGPVYVDGNGVPP